MAKMMTAAEARRRSQKIREDAKQQTSSAVRYEMEQVAEQYDLLAASLEETEEDS